MSKLNDRSEYKGAAGMADRDATINELDRVIYNSTGGGCIRCGKRTRYGWLCHPCLGKEIETKELNAHFQGVQNEWEGEE
jgi:hypothetical protein